MGVAFHLLLMVSPVILSLIPNEQKTPPDCGAHEMRFSNPQKTSPEASVLIVWGQWSRKMFKPKLHQAVTKKPMVKFAVCRGYYPVIEGLIAKSHEKLEGSLWNNRNNGISWGFVSHCSTSFTFKSPDGCFPWFFSPCFTPPKVTKSKPRNLGFETTGQMSCWKWCQIVTSW